MEGVNTEALQTTILKKKAKEEAITERNISSTFHADVRELSIFLKRANSDMSYVKSCLISFFSVR